MNDQEFEELLGQELSVYELTQLVESISGLPPKVAHKLVHLIRTNRTREMVEEFDKQMDNVRYWMQR